ncbi:hypothetical protein Ancab_016633 [Ancistrocladus abbreviatus]
MGGLLSFTSWDLTCHFLCPCAAELLVDCVWANNYISGIRLPLHLHLFGWCFVAVTIMSIFPQISWAWLWEYVKSLILEVKEQKSVIDYVRHHNHLLSPMKKPELDAALVFIGFDAMSAL